MSHSCKSVFRSVLRAPQTNGPADPFAAGKAKYLWCSADMKADYLRLLDHFAYDALPPPSDDMRPSTGGTGPVECQLEAGLLTPRVSTVWTWDTSHRKTLAIKISPMSLDELLSQDDVWKERTRQVALLAQGNSQVVLVQSLFQFNPLHSAATFAAVRYSPDAPERRQYSIISSVFRLGQRRADMVLARGLRGGTYLDI